MGFRASLRTYKQLNTVARRYSSFSKSKLGTIKSTVDNISHSELSSGQKFKDLINYHHERLSKKIDDEEREYSQLYDLTVKLSQLLETSKMVLEEDKRDILNLLIEKFTKYNYGVSTLAFKQLGNSKSNLTPCSAAALVQNNPGRVSSSYQMYKNLKPEVNHDELAVAALNKLVFGDLVEIKENLHSVTIEKLIQILDVYANIANKNLIPKETSKQLVIECSKLQVPSLITQLAIPSEVLEELIEEDAIEFQAIDYVFIFEAAMNNGISLSGNAILKIFTPISKLLLNKGFKESENAQLLRIKTGINVPELPALPELVDELREQILELGLDEDFKVKMDLIKSAAFHSKDFSKAVYFFQNYQSKIPENSQGQSDLKSITSLAAIFECIDKDKTELLTVAESLIPQTPAPAANNLASLILYYGWFNNDDKAFDLYNQSLELYMKPFEGNEVNRGMLIQALTAVSLLGKELGLAKVIKQKSMENKLINDSWEARLTNLMKDYGELIEASAGDDAKFKDGMKDAILNQIASLSSFF